MVIIIIVAKSVNLCVNKHIAGHVLYVNWSFWNVCCCSCLLAVLSYNHDVTIFVNSTGKSWNKVHANIKHCTI